MVNLIERLESLAEELYMEGRDSEAAIVYDALTKAYAEAESQMAQKAIVAKAKANVLKSKAAPPHPTKSKEIVFTITKTTGSSE